MILWENYLGQWCTYITGQVFNGPTLEYLFQAKMKWLSLALAAALAVPSQAALRFGCSTLTIQRLDPLVQPGRTPSSHVHQIVGGNAFHPNMTGDIGNQGTCTTCTFSEDFSNYWTAVMYFKHTNGTYKRVPIMQNTALPEPINGGMTIYYTQQDFNSNGNVKMTAFKPVIPVSKAINFRPIKTCGRDSAWSSATQRRPASSPSASSLSAWSTRVLGSPSSMSSPRSPAEAAS
jgi:hypothetical protein